MPRAYGYIRVSTQKQVDKGMSLEEQQDSIERYYEWKLKPAGFVWGGIFADKGVSASIKFLNRQAAAALDCRLAHGDCVVITKLDRAFRNTKDTINNVERWQDSGIGFHFLDLNVNTNEPSGMFMLQLMAAFAEMEKARIRERTLDAIAMRKAKRIPHNHLGCYGCRIEGRGKNRRLVDDENELAVGQYIVNMKAAGKSYRWIAKDLTDRGIRTWAGRIWDRNRVWAVHHFHLNQEKEKQQALTEPPENGTINP